VPSNAGDTIFPTNAPSLFPTRTPTLAPTRFPTFSATQSNVDFCATKQNGVCDYLQTAVDKPNCTHGDYVDCGVYCLDTNNGTADSYSYGCNRYTSASWCGAYDTATFSSRTMCCACGGGSGRLSLSPEPTNTPTPVPTQAPTPVPTFVPTTPAPTPTPTTPTPSGVPYYEPCAYARDGVCDVPSNCDAGDFIDCGVDPFNTRTPTPRPTLMPTPVPTLNPTLNPTYVPTPAPITYSTVWITFPASSEAITTTERDAVKTSIASYLGIPPDRVSVSVYAGSVILSVVLPQDSAGTLVSAISAGVVTTLGARPPAP
jgi:hypothetical protein